MSTAKNWISAFRLRTLPLSLSTIALGSGLAASQNQHNLTVTLLALLTTVLLQILSNLANDYGDGIKGTDNDARLGPMRAVQSGQISHTQMRTAVIFFIILSMASGITLLWVAFRTELLYALLFLALGLAAVWAAVKYTVGDSAYGYRGLGDLFVFLFFGILGTGGTYFLHTLQFSPYVLLPAGAVGHLSTGVLNLNNLRDIKNDKASGKNTVVVLIGYANARIYHLFLTLLPFVFMSLYVALNGYNETVNYLFLAALPFILLHIKNLFSVQNPRDLDPMLKQLALTSVLFVILSIAGILL